MFSLHSTVSHDVVVDVGDGDAIIRPVVRLDVALAPPDDGSHRDWDGQAALENLVASFFWTDGGCSEHAALGSRNVGQRNLSRCHSLFGGMLEGYGQAGARRIQASHLEHNAGVHVLKAIDADAGCNEGVEDGLSPQDVNDDWNLRRVTEWNVSDELAEEVRSLRHEVAMLLVRQRHKESAVVARIKAAIAGL